jgi:hypothetical protein
MTAAPGSLFHGFPACLEIFGKLLPSKTAQIEKSGLNLSTDRPASGGYHTWSKFNAHRWSVLNAQKHLPRLTGWAAIALLLVAVTASPSSPTSAWRR